MKYEVAKLGKGWERGEGALKASKNNYQKRKTKRNQGGLVSAPRFEI